VRQDNYGDKFHGHAEKNWSDHSGKFLDLQGCQFEVYQLEDPGHRESFLQRSGFEAFADYYGIVKARRYHHAQNDLGNPEKYCF
jgi:hypothetical protein